MCTPLVNKIGQYGDPSVQLISSFWKKKSKVKKKFRTLSISLKLSSCTYMFKGNFLLKISFSTQCESPATKTWDTLCIPNYLQQNFFVLYSIALHTCIFYNFQRKTLKVCIIFWIKYFNCFFLYFRFKRVF